MKKRTKPAKKSSAPLASELLLLPDGRILAHNLTPAFAGLLAGLTADCEPIMSRVTHHPSPSHELPD